MNWQEYMTGIMSTNVNDFGATEIQHITMFLIIFPVFDYFDIPYIPLYKNVRLIDILVFLTVIL